jgi:hypothetical protein
MAQHVPVGLEAKLGRRASALDHAQGIRLRRGATPSGDIASRSACVHRRTANALLRGLELGGRSKFFRGYKVMPRFGYNSSVLGT